MSKAISVHRCRFAHYVPSSIVALALSTDGSRMAMARHNGDIEIWAVTDKGPWYSERVIFNKESVRSLAWARMNGEDRLFSSGFSGNIVEWDLTTSRQKQTTDSFGGPVWCIAVDPAGNHLAAACDNGLRLFDISYGDIQFKKAFSKVGLKRYLSVAWNKEGDTLYTGGADSHVRQWKLDSQASTLGLRLAKVKSICNIWTISVLADETILTGDSRGVLSVWDPITTTEVYSVKSHDADILAMAYFVQPDSEIVVVATGADSNMVSIRRIPNNGPGGYTWVLGGKFRHHKRDVFALSITPTQLIASGGLDGGFHVLPITSLVQTDKHPHLEQHPPLPPRPLVTFSPARRRFLYMAGTSTLEVWQAGRELEGSLDIRCKEMPGQSGLALPIADMPKLLAKLKIKTGERTVSCALSPNGKMIALADTLAVKIFRLDDVKGKHGDGVRVTKIEVRNAELASWVVWAGDDYVVAGDFKGGVQLIDVLPTPSVVATCPADWTRPAQAWTGRVATSGDKWIAASRPDGSVDVFMIDKSGDQIELKSRGVIAPSGATGVTVLAFQPNSSLLFGVRQGLPNRKLGESFFFDVESMAYAKGRVPKIDHPISAVEFDPSDPTRMMCVSPSAISFFRPDDAHAPAITVKAFSFVLHASFSEDGESLFVVERPVAHITQKLPPPITHKHKYGKG